MENEGEIEIDPKPTCYDCIHLLVCKYTPAYSATGTVPFRSDAHIKPFMTAVNHAYAQACKHYSDRDSG